jgi:hypothetical protein
VKNTLAYWIVVLFATFKTFKVVSQGPYSKHLFKWSKLAMVLHFASLERLLSDKHSSLFDPFVSYEEKEVL